MKTIVLTGGGTAGHIMPNVALLSLLSKHFSKIAYIGSTGGMEKDIISQYDFVDYYEISATKLSRKKLFKNLLVPFKLMHSINQAKKILKKINPRVVFSKGGYVALPVVLAAKKLKIPVIAHESDLTLGLANRISKCCATKICTTFKKTAESLGEKGVWTGSPIVESKTPSLIKKDKPILFVTGGSLGAQAINKVVHNSLDSLCKKFYVIHQVGKNNLDNSIHHENYEQIEFASDMKKYILSSAVVVSRAGSNTIFELAYYSKPMLLIPLPKGASRGDQVENAKYFENNGYAKVLFQENLSPSTLTKAIDELYSQKEKYVLTLKKAHIQNGSQKIVQTILAQK